MRFVAAVLGYLAGRADGEAEEEPLAIDRRASLRQRLLAVAVASVGAAAAATVSFALSVYEAAHPQPLREVGANEPVDTGQWIVTLLEARIDDVAPNGRTPAEPKKFLSVGFDLNNRSAATSAAFSNLLMLDSVIQGAAGPEFYSARDRRMIAGLHPDMPERIMAVWELSAAQSPPATVRLLIGSQIYKRRDNFYGASNWLDRDPIAVANLPVLGSGQVR